MTTIRILFSFIKFEILWAVPTFEPSSAKEHPEAKVVLAADQDALPALDRLGAGVYEDAPYQEVRIPSAHCLVEALIRLAARDYVQPENTGLITNTWPRTVREFMQYCEDRVQVQYMDPRCRDFLAAMRKTVDLDPYFRIFKRSLEGNH